MILRVRRLHPAARVPSRSHPGDAGLDLHAVEAVDLAPGARAKVGTGIALELPAGHAGWVVPRSGLAARHGIGVVNAPGLIDAGYRGELSVVLINMDRQTGFAVEVGTRIAQLVVTPVALPELLEVAELEASVRGRSGFGSTGI
jgi:dUTP pyrophosphatase